MLLLLLQLLLLSALPLPSLCCTASAHHKVIAARRTAVETNAIVDEEVNAVPSLFKFDGHDAEAKKRKRLACSTFQNGKNKGFNVKESNCAVVHISLDAFKEKKVKFPLDAMNPNKYIILKKLTEEGMEFLHDRSSKAPVVLTYRNGNSTELFIVKQGIVFGSVDGEVAGVRGRFHLMSCPGDEKDNDKSCQVLLFKKLSENDSKIEKD